MRKHNIYIKTALAAFTVILSACSSDNDALDNSTSNQDKTVSNKAMTFRASMDGETTRTDFNGNNTIWSEKDAISILNTASVPEESDRESQADFTISEGVGTKEATFTGGPIKANGNNADNFYAFYPATTLSTSNNTIKASASVPTVQTAIDGSYDQSLHFMSAYSTNATFNFKNVCSLIKITLTNNTSVCRVKVVANPTLTNVYDQQFNYTSITGNFDATIGSDGTASVSATDAKSTYVELRAEGDDGTAKTVIGNGTFYLVVLPANITNGFTLLFEKTNGTIYQRISTKVTKFERNKMYDLGSFDCSGTPDGMTELTNVVDLDLPSGTIWATKNLSTTRSGIIGFYTYTHDFVASETEYGDYFSYGDHYVHMTPFSTSNTKISNKTLKKEYDVAYSFDNRYCTPIYAQLYEFYNNFSNDYKDSFKGNNNPNKGAKFWTSTGRYIWIPYAGHYWAANLQDIGSKGSLWSRTNAGRTSLITTSDDAYCLDLKEDDNENPVLDSHSGILDGAAEWHDNTYSGRSIRPVVTNVQIAPIL